MEILTVKRAMEMTKEKGLDGTYVFLSLDTPRGLETPWSGDMFEIPEEYHNYIVEKSIVTGKNFKTGRPIFTFYVKEKDEMWEELQQLRKELEAYKATGLTPADIIEMDRLYSEKCCEVAECRKKIVALELKEGN